MAESTNNLCVGVIFLLVSAVFIAASIWTLLDGNWEAIIMLVLSLTFMSVSLCWVLPYFQQIVLTETAVQVFLGPIQLQEMRAENICTILYAVVNISVRGAGEDTEVPVLVLSSRTSDYLKMMYRRFAEKECSQSFASDQEKENYILQYAIDTHIGNSGKNLHLPKAEGVWMEYTPERFDILRQLYPNAEDCTE